MEVLLVIGGRSYPLSERSAILLFDRIRGLAGDDPPLRQLADAIHGDLEAGGSPEPIDLGTNQIEALADILWSADEEPLRQLHTACTRYLHPG